MKIAIIAKKILLDIIKDSSKTLNRIWKAILIILITFVVLIAIPVAIITGIPMWMLLNDDEDPTKAHYEALAEYKEVARESEEALKLKEWVEEKKEEYEWCDSIRVHYTPYSEFAFIDYRKIVAIDAIVKKQKFVIFNSWNLGNIAKKLIYYNHYTREYWVTIKERDDEGNVISERKEKRIRAIIIVRPKTIKEYAKDNRGVFKNGETTGICENIYKTLSEIEEDIYLEDLDRYNEIGIKLTYYNQKDSRWGSIPFGGSTIHRGGCGPTNLAMVLDTFLKERVTPVEVAKWAEDNGYVYGGASSWDLIPDYARYRGLEVVPIRRRNPSRVMDLISRGYPIIAIMGKGEFTSSGHFIILKGITEDGKIVVSDSFSYSKNNKAYDSSVIFGQASQKRGLNAVTYWAIKPPPD